MQSKAKVVESGKDYLIVVLGQHTYYVQIVVNRVGNITWNNQPVKSLTINRAIVSAANKFLAKT